mgnify:CR=1 FL=1
MADTESLLLTVVASAISAAGTWAISLNNFRQERSKNELRLREMQISFDQLQAGKRAEVDAEIAQKDAESKTQRDRYDAEMAQKYSDMASKMQSDMNAKFEAWLLECESQVAFERKRADDIQAELNQERLAHKDTDNRAKVLQSTIDTMTNEIAQLKSRIEELEKQAGIVTTNIVATSPATPAANVSKRKRALKKELTPPLDEARSILVADNYSIEFS